MKFEKKAVIFDLDGVICEALAGMAEDGTLTRLSMKYFGTDISKDQ